MYHQDLMSTGYQLGRRDLLLASIGLPARAKTPQLRTLSDWLRVEPSVRRSELQVCLESIRIEDARIHAWVQVLPVTTLS